MEWRKNRTKEKSWVCSLFHLWRKNDQPEKAETDKPEKSQKECSVQEAMGKMLISKEDEMLIKL